MRLTRAAQRAQQDPDETPDAVDPTERAPLNEISPNASPEQISAQEVLPKKTPAKKVKGKGGAKKGAKDKKDKVAASEEVQEVLGDDREEAGSFASDAAMENLVEDASSGEQLVLDLIRKAR